MVPALPTYIPRGCKRCNGDLGRDLIIGETDYTCLLCAESYDLAEVQGGHREGVLIFECPDGYTRNTPGDTASQIAGMTEVTGVSLQHVEGEEVVYLVVETAGSIAHQDIRTVLRNAGYQEVRR